MKRCFSENNIYFVKNNNFFKKQFHSNRITTDWKSQFFIIIRSKLKVESVNSDPGCQITY